MPTLDLYEEHVLFFRARRGHLAGPGAADAVAAARAILGAQSQQLPPSLHALALRTAGRPAARAIADRLGLAPRSLVRTWGQRDTLHLYAPDDWPLVVAARGDWAPGGRAGPLPTARDLDRALRVVRDADGPVTRTHLLGVAPKAYERAIADRAVAAGLDPQRLAAGRLLWALANRGDLCHADKVGAEQAYAHRTAWHPDLPWAAVATTDAALALTRRYLATFGAATPQDVGHFFSARVGTARSWLEALADEIVEVRCGDRTGLVALAADARVLRAAPPKTARDWPVRLLPLWDTMLMGHADKSWLVPDVDERPLVWRKAAMVAATVVARGRIVATWTQKRSAKRLTVTVTPLGGWRDRLHAAAVRREANVLAGHVGVADAVVEIA